MKQNNPDIKKEEYETLVNILDNSVIVDPSDQNDTLGKDLQEIFKLTISDKNTHKFSDLSHLDPFKYAKIGCITDIDLINQVPLSERVPYACKRILYHYCVSTGAKKTSEKNKNFLDKSVQIVSSLLGFKSMLDYRSAGIRDNTEDGLSFVDKLKGG